MQVRGSSTIYARQAVAQLYLENTPRNLAKIGLTSGVSRFQPRDVIVNEMSIPVNNAQLLSGTKAENLKSAANTSNAKRIAEALSGGNSSGNEPSALKLLGEAPCNSCDNRKYLSDGGEGAGNLDFSTPLRLFTCNCAECGQVFVSGSSPATPEDMAIISGEYAHNAEKPTLGQTADYST